MPNYSTIGGYELEVEESADIRGAAVYGTNDEELGKIDDAIFDADTGDIRYVVVDMSGWLHSRRFIIPADKLYSSPEHKDDFKVDLTKAQIEKFPPYEENALGPSDKFLDYERRHRAAWPATAEARTGARGPRWSAFEGRVREHRDRIIAHVPQRERKVS